MSRILINNTASPVLLADVGQSVPGSGQLVIDPVDYPLFANSNNVIQKLADNTLKLNDGINDLSLSHALDALKGAYRANPKTSDNRDIIAVNRVSKGASIYPVGGSSDLINNTYQGGEDLFLDTNNSFQAVLRFLDHYEAIGGRAIFEGCDLEHYIDATLVAPATVATNAAGDFDKMDVGGFNIYIPTSPGAGAWNMDLTSKIGSSQVLSASPVPSPTKTGLFDYDESLNLITPNYSSQGGFNLFDIDIPLFMFCHKCWASKGDGMSIVVESTDVKSRMLYNFWKIVFEMKKRTGSPLITARAGIVMTTAVKANK